MPAGTLDPGASYRDALQSERGSYGDGYSQDFYNRLNAANVLPDSDPGSAANQAINAQNPVLGTPTALTGQQRAQLGLPTTGTIQYVNGQPATSNTVGSIIPMTPQQKQLYAKMMAGG